MNLAEVLRSRFTTVWLSGDSIYFCLKWIQFVDVLEISIVSTSYVENCDVGMTSQSQTGEQSLFDGGSRHRHTQKRGGTSAQVEA
jgi:hypothetical protein